MAVQRYIGTGLWDRKFFQELTASEKLLYLYLKTNPCTNLCGIYEITERRMEFDTGISLEEIQNHLSKFESLGTAFYTDSYIVFPAWPDEQKWQKSPSICEGMKNELEALPGYILNFAIEHKYPEKEIQQRYDEIQQDRIRKKRAQE